MVITSIVTKSKVESEGNRKLSKREIAEMYSTLGRKSRQAPSQGVHLPNGVSLRRVDRQYEVPINWELNERISLSSASSNVECDLNRVNCPRSNKRLPLADSDKINLRINGGKVDKHSSYNNFLLKPRSNPWDLKLMNVSGFEEDKSKNTITDSSSTRRFQSNVKPKVENDKARFKVSVRSRAKRISDDSAVKSSVNSQRDSLPRNYLRANNRKAPTSKKDIERNQCDSADTLIGPTRADKRQLKSANRQLPAVVAVKKNSDKTREKDFGSINSRNKVKSVDQKIDVKRSMKNQESCSVVATAGDCCLESSKIYPWSYHVNDTKQQPLDETNSKLNCLDDDNSPKRNVEVVVHDRQSSNCEPIVQSDSVKSSIDDSCWTSDSSIDPSYILKDKVKLIDAQGDQVKEIGGWIKIHMAGTDGSLVYLTLQTNASDVCRDVLLNEDLSLFVQYNEGPGRRLAPHERPLKMQDDFLMALGYTDPKRREQIGIDSQLSCLIRFSIGPSPPLPDLKGFTRCGLVNVLKGHVFPQWKRRPIVIVGSKLLLYTAKVDSSPEWIEVGRGIGSVSVAPSRMDKLVLRVTGHPNVHDPRQNKSNTSNNSKGDESTLKRHLYLGFQQTWERDLWHQWIAHATELEASDKTLDLSKGGIWQLPRTISVFPAVEELLLGQNQLTDEENNLQTLHAFPNLQAIRLEDNHFKSIPQELLELQNLISIDLTGNGITEISRNIEQLTELEELLLDRNAIQSIPNELTRLRNLRNLSLGGNQLEDLPGFLKMRALNFTDVLSKGEVNGKCQDKEANALQRINLRNNRLKGNIILGNYGNLTHLDLSENSIEKLDISALQQLQSVRCSRNLLSELTVCGRHLVSLIAGNNRLKRLTIEPTPSKLEHLDISYNLMDALPEWIVDLPLLCALFASHNALTSLPDGLLSHAPRLQVLHLPHNKLQALPPPRLPINLVHMTLQSNAITALPPKFFAHTKKLRVLNLSNNRLVKLPYVDSDDDDFDDEVNTSKIVSSKRRYSLEKLYLTGNKLTDSSLDALSKFTSLRVLHLAYNVLDTVPESCIVSWRDLEELVLSGNRLQYLPENMTSLKHLRVLRAHSNRLLTCPSFSHTNSLKVLDIAHNHLDKVNLACIVPPQLEFLDISCNSRLHVDLKQFQMYRSQRPVSLVDVSGQNRTNLPSHQTPDQKEAMLQQANEKTWKLGFSEAAGSREKLYITQVRNPSFCNTEGLFGIFDGNINQEAPSALRSIIPRVLLEERTVRENREDYLKYTLLSANKELRDSGQKYGLDATLIHIVKLKQPSPKRIYKNPNIPDDAVYQLKVASFGEASAVLCRADGPLVLTPNNLQKMTSPFKGKQRRTMNNDIGESWMFASGRSQCGPIEAMLKRMEGGQPIVNQVLLERDDEFVIIANRKLWEVLSVQEAVREARAEASPVLAAKRLQDLAQAYGAEDNLSVIVVRFALDRFNEDLNGERLFSFELNSPAKGRKRELNTKQDNECSCPCCIPMANKTASGACCCHVDKSYYFKGGDGIAARNHTNNCSRSSKISDKDQRGKRIVQGREERSSPSGQSDNTFNPSEKNLKRSSVRKSKDMKNNRTFIQGAGAGGNKCDNNKYGSQSQLKNNSHRSMPPATINSEDDFAVSSLRNADCIGGGLSEEQFRCWEYMLEQNTQLLFDKELDTLASPNSLQRGQSRSTPQLTVGNLPFLSKRFGSARSFDPVFSRSSALRFGSSRRPPMLNGGPNAAYFGSLQRLMPYNLEYDFAVIQERNALDSFEQDPSRMQQYWGVATTEL